MLQIHEGTDVNNMSLRVKTSMCTGLKVGNVRGRL